MSDQETREIAGLTVRIDRLLCVGFEDCVTAAPGVFRMDPDGIATFLPDATADRATLEEACRICPVDAIELLDADGTVVAP